MKEFAETWYSGIRYCFELRDIVYDSTSEIQHIQVLDSVSFGRVMVLDDRVETTEKDEYIYHEMLVHVPMMAHPHPKRVLIIGGGDGGALRRALEHPVEHVRMVEIDRDVVEVSRAFLPSISAGAFDDPRAELIIDDGIKYLHDTTERFDVILVDSTDPIGPAVGLFEEPFYRDAERALRDGGILVTQNSSPFLMLTEVKATVERLRSIFPIVRTYVCAIPAYVGVLWCFTAASMTLDPAAVDPLTVASRLRAIGSPTGWYTPSIHNAAFVLPNFLNAQLGTQGSDDPKALPIPVADA